MSYKLEIAALNLPALAEQRPLDMEARPSHALSVTPGLGVGRKKESNSTKGKGGIK